MIKGETAPKEKPSEPKIASQSWRRTYGRRRGRKLSGRRALLLSSLLDRLRIDLSVRPGAGDLAGLFSQPVDEVWLEIGFGAGEHMIWQAENNPKIGIIGAEPYINGVAAALSAIEARRLESRIRIHAEDGIPLLRWLPHAAISRAFILFPDPWPKKRHHERRLISGSVLNELARVLIPAAELRIASDASGYAQEALDLANLHPAFEIANVFDSRDRVEFPNWPVTRYEAKAGKAGRSSTFLVVTRR